MSATASRPTSRPLLRNTRLLLMAGFGGLLILMTFVGIDAMDVLRDIQRRNDAIRRDFLNRNRILNQLRSDLFVSGTYARDYLLEPEPQNAAKYLGLLEKTRLEMEAEMHSYGTSLRPEEKLPYGNLRHDLNEYWRVLEPVMKWSPEQRHKQGYAFLRDELFPRRMSIVGIADQIATVNEQQSNNGNMQVVALFNQFKLRLSMTLFITLGLGLLLAAFSMQKILSLEKQSAARFIEIVQARGELKELSTRLVEAQESERRLISRELHDEVGQSLSALLVGLSNLTAAIPESANAVLKPHIDGIRKLAEGTLGVVRNISLLLRPSMLDDLGLLPALQWQAREVSKRTGLRVDVAAEGLPEDLPDEYNTGIYRVVQEALNNCARHSKAQSVRITIGQRQGTLLLSIQDDGQGFRPGVDRGVGLVGMEERVTHLGGQFKLVSEPGRGTLIEIALPYQEQEKGELARKA